MKTIYRLTAWIALIPASIIIYLISHAAIIFIGRFLAWLFQANEIEKFAENIVSPIVSAGLAFLLPLRMFPKGEWLPSAVSSFILISMLGLTIGFSVYGLSRKSVVAGIFSATVVMALSYTIASRAQSRKNINNLEMHSSTDDLAKGDR